MTNFSLDKDLTSEIKDLLFEYAKIPSFTHTISEKQVEPFFENWFHHIPYFQKNTTHWGLHPVRDDHLNRSVAWGLVKGEGAKTVVMIHHYDVVAIDEYETVKSSAFDFEQINDQLDKMLHKFDPESLADLKSDQWQFGRGSADMKAGGAIQMTLLKQAAENANFKGNLLMIAVPDEESLSAGMRSAIQLMASLKEKHQLSFSLMINSEPHQRFTDETGVIYEGSIGKMMPLVYVRGALAHVGRIYEGFNPLPLMSEIVCQTDLNMDLTDTIDDEVSPPPCWMYLKDRKQHYDVSIPTEICGYLSMLVLKATPDEILDKLSQIAKKAFENVIARMKDSYSQYQKVLGKQLPPLPWQVNVKTFADLVVQAEKDSGEAFKIAYQNHLTHHDQQIKKGEKDLMTVTFDLIEMTLAFIKDKTPMIVIGLSPPFYPNVTNELMSGDNTEVLALPAKISQFAAKNWQQPYISRKYFTGISDLSYAISMGNQTVTDLIKKNMPLWGNTYRIPFDDIEITSMPCLNIGPWGKDFHRITERVFKEDLYHRTPKLITYIINTILAGDNL